MTISSEALPAIEALERAQAPEGLWPSYEIALREQKRLGAYWRLDELSTWLPDLVIIGAFTVLLQRPTLWVALAAAAVGLIVMLGREHLAKRSLRKTALKRVNVVIDRWRHLVPAMREARA